MFVLFLKNVRFLKLRYRIMNEITLKLNDVSTSYTLEHQTRALVVLSDGEIEMATWLGENGWYEEGSLVHSGGIGGKLENVVKYALIPKV